MQDVRRYVAPLFFTLAVLVLTTRLAAGSLALPIVSLEHIKILTFVLLLNFLHLLVVFVVVSMVRARDFQNSKTKQLNVRALWSSMAVNPVTCSLAAVGLFVGVTACGNLVEIYRTRQGVWHDAALWELEQGLFSFLLTSPLNVPALWDRVYFMVWSGLFLSSSILFVTGQKRRFFLLVTALVWSFVLTRVIAIYFPSQGPAFFRPELFNLSGTTSGDVQRVLALYMAGQVPQNGMLPGTMAMPSLHVGMPFLATYLLARAFPRTLWLTVPWFMLNWASTVFLGWHYAVDGVGGIAVALMALGIACIQHRAWDMLLGGEPRQNVQQPRIEVPSEGTS